MAHAEAGTAVNQLIEHCEIHSNGDDRLPGFNHNLYLGGTSVTLRFSEVHHALTGHNVKSSAHFNRIEYSYVHHSNNREFDLVGASDNAPPGSHSVLLGNIIAKDPRAWGNRAVIHFGQQGGRGTGLGGMLNVVAQAGRLDALLSIMVLIAIIGAAIDGLIFRRMEHAVRVRWGLVE